MKRLQIVVAIGLITFGLAWTTPAWAQKGAIPTAGREQERRSFAINLARAIQKAEADYKAKHGTYGNWDSLVGNGYFTSAGKVGLSRFPHGRPGPLRQRPGNRPRLAPAPEHLQQRQFL